MAERDPEESMGEGSLALTKSDIMAFRHAMIDQFGKELDPFILIRFVAQDIGGHPMGDSQSLFNYFEARAGNFEPIRDRVIRLNGPIPLFDRMTLRLLFDGKFPRKAGKKSGLLVPAQTRDLVEWLQWAHGFPKDSAVVRCSELLGISARSVRARLKAAEEPSTLIQCAKDVLVDPPNDGSNLLKWQRIMFPDVDF